MMVRIAKVEKLHDVGWWPLSWMAARCAMIVTLGWAIYLAQFNVVWAETSGDSTGEQTPPAPTQPTAAAPADEQPTPATATTEVTRTAQTSPAGELEGEAELRWILDRLDLTESQQKDADALLETYRYRTGEGADVIHLNNLLQDYQAAEEAGDQQRLAEIKAELSNARPDVKARREFLAALRAMLPESQQRQLSAIESFLRDFPAGRVTPLHIFKLAKALGLSPEQLRELDQVHTEFRTRRIPQLGAPKRIPLSGVESEFAQAIRALLTPEQRVTFDRELDATQPHTEREAALGKGGVR